MEFHSNQHIPEELVDATKGPFLRKSIEKSPFEARFYDILWFPMRFPTSSQQPSPRRDLTATVQQLPR